MKKEHQYSISINWTGNRGEGTRSYKSYNRSHTISVTGKEKIECSSDPSFLGDKTKYNPEELLVASLSSCHMLWFLHLCSDAGIVVVNYTDNAKGVMAETENGGGHFVEVVLHPMVTVEQQSMVERIPELHDHAHKLCFIANSVNFPVRHEASASVVVH